MEEIKLHQFAEKLELLGYSKRSIKDYPYDMGRFMRYLEEKEGVHDLAAVTPEHLTAYHTHLQYTRFRKGRYLAGGSVVKRLEAVKLFYTYGAGQIANTATTTLGAMNDINMGAGNIATGLGSIGSSASNFSNIIEAGSNIGRLVYSIRSVFENPGNSQRLAWNFATEYGTTGTGLTNEVRTIENSVDQAYQQATGTDDESTVTYTTNGRHSTNSRHYSGNAVDLRTRNMTDAQRQDWAQRLRNALGNDYDVVNEGDHIHVEYDPHH